MDGLVNSVPTTGAMSLETISENEIKQLISNKIINTEPKYSYLKKSERLHKENNLKKVEEPTFLYNGINALESHWKPFKFGVIIIETDNKMGMLLIEEAFREINGKPPLSMV